MYDQYQRNIHYMRISITDRCNFRCMYCKPFHMLHHEDILSYEELLKVCKCAIKLGIDTFKITGGEPCARNGYLSFIQNVKELEGCKKVTLTTNGSLLNKNDLDTLKDIGLDGMNISLDTLDKENNYYLKNKKKQKKCENSEVIKPVEDGDYIYMVLPIKMKD